MTGPGGSLRHRNTGGESEPRQALPVAISRFGGRGRALKIAQLCPYDIHRPGGVQRHIIDLSTALSQMGHDVSIIAPRVSGNGNRLTHTDVSTLPIVYVGRGVLVPLNKTQFEITWALGEQLKHLGEVLQSSEFDVIHFHTVSAPFLPMQALRKSRAANVATFHEVPPDTMTGSIQQFLLRVHRRRLISRLDRVILASGAQKAISLTQDLSRISIVPPCSDLARFHADAAPIDHYRDERMNILFLGRLEPRIGRSRAPEGISRASPARVAGAAPLGGRRSPALDARTLCQEAAHVGRRLSRRH